MIPAAGVARRDSAVLVVVDVQERLAAAMDRRDQVVSRCGLLVRVAGIVGVPIVVTRQYPNGLGDTEAPLLAALEAARADGASVQGVDKVSFDCFAEPTFCDAVTGTGRVPTRAGRDGDAHLHRADRAGRPCRELRRPRRRRRLLHARTRTPRLRAGSACARGGGHHHRRVGRLRARRTRGDRRVPRSAAGREGLEHPRSRATLSALREPSA